ncbi:MAG TPA: nuclear transport factor 2 family protein [Ohtaekwangia sp.]|nr:nuclear transport factor 2 family protein [Ohtaekwangia sp.]
MEEEVKHIELEWNKAIVKNDVNAMAKFMSDEWIIFSGDGNITTKEMFLRLVERGELIHTEMDFEILDVRNFGNTSLVMAKGTSSGIWKGQTFSNYEVSATVFIKDNDQWLAVQTMVAPATKK